MKKRILSILLCLCLAATLLPAAALADGTETATSITVDQSSVVTGGTFTGTLKDAAGLGLAGQTITLYNGDQPLGTAATDASGKFEFTITLTPGSYSVILVYQGIAGTYASADLNPTLTVTAGSTATKLTVSQTTVAAGGNFTGTLTDAAGNPLASRSVSVAIQSMVDAVATDSNGQFTQAIALAPGSYPYTVSYAGEDSYEASSAAGTLTVVTTVTETKLAVDRYAATNGQSFTGTLTDAAGNPLAGQSVSVSIDMATGTYTGPAQNWGTFVTDQNGRFSMPINTDPGVYKFSVRYGGGGAFRAAEPLHGMMTVTNAPTSGTAATKLTVTTADERSITGTLTDAAGNALSGKTVTIRLERLSTGQNKDYYATTGPDKADGEIRFSLDINLADGKYSYTVLYAGDDTYAPAEPVAGDFTVNRVILKNSGDTIELMGNGLDASDTLITESISAADCPLLLKLAGSDQVVGAYHIYLKSGSKGVGMSLYLTFRVPAEDAGKVFTLLHQKDDQTTETFRAVAGSDGTVTFGPVGSLSPFLLTLPASASSPKTGDCGSAPWLWLALASAGAAAGLMPVKKRRRQEEK